MNLLHSSLLRLVLCMIAAALVPAAGAADSYPSKPVRVIVPFPAGGATDILGRAVAQKLGELLGQTMIVVNVDGASTMIGAERVARSTADGYSLLVATSTTFATNPHLYKKMTYTLDDFAPVSLLAKGPLALALSHSLPVKTLQEFVTYAKARPGQLNYGTTGRGGGAHLTGAMICSVLGIKMQDVPYKGSAPALVDVMGGSLSMHIDQVSTSLPLYKAGKINVVAVTGEQRAEAAPDVPTFAESGYPRMVRYSLAGMFAPAGTPRAAVDVLNSTLKIAFQREDLRANFRQYGTILEWAQPERTLELFKADFHDAGALIKSMNIEMQ